MVELDIQLLVGAAVTVFLALIFFGVVVLWDVALALRSVGDKIDKLEDNIDDDLMNIAHALDGISNGSNNGGTQLHLSGGTISSGTQEQGQPTQGQPQGPQQAPQQAANETVRQPSQQPRTGQQPSQAGDPGAVDGENEPSAPVGGDGDGSLEQSADGTADADNVRADGDDVPTDESTSDDDAAESTAPSKSVHSRAERSRGRFTTSPDRTAWYATPLDRETIRSSQPMIAGALTDGSDAAVDDSEIIAAGPVESAAPSGAAEADGVSKTAGVSDTDETTDSDPDKTVNGDSDESDEPSISAETNRDDDHDGTNPSDGSAVGETDDVDSATQEVDEPDETSNSASTGADVLAFEEDGPTAGEDLSPTDSADADATDATVDPETESSEQSTTETGIEPVDETALEDTSSDENGDTVETDDGAVSETDDGTIDPVGGDVEAFAFDAVDDVTVEAAVETINEDAPAPELSSHRFDVTAEVFEGEDDDRDGAALLFEFDTETVDISGSTKRLLQYQMRSFADRDSTPDSDVRIGRDRIVIEIPDSDGAAVQRWGEAAVSIIDRTLYLSDNSSDDN
ncbi:AAA family ATPase [Natronorubrum sp. DTA28]|uniref:AAA family ATPase n=1 Tax=Natronorubrum sp. DTA28 TaxID=3447019 RepID=UPI003F84F06C